MVSYYQDSIHALRSLDLKIILLYDNSILSERRFLHAQLRKDVLYLISVETEKQYDSCVDWEYNFNYGNIYSIDYDN